MSTAIIVAAVAGLVAVAWRFERRIAHSEAVDIAEHVLHLARNEIARIDWTQPSGAVQRRIDLEAQAAVVRAELARPGGPNTRRLNHASTELRRIIDEDR